MGRNQDTKNKKKQQEEEEQEESVEEINDDQDSDNEQGDEQQGDYDEEDFDQEDQIDGDEVILEKIEAKIGQAEQAEKLSWAVIYQIKKQQAELNQQMQKQIDLINQKYELQRIPLITKIAEAVAGKKLDKSLYSENEFVKSINLNKTKPAPIKGYWSKVFDGCALIGNQDDIELLEKLVFFRVDVSDNSDLEIVFEFEENEFFDKKIQIKVTGSVAQGNFKKQTTFTVKKALNDENSLFGLLTGKDSDDQEFFDTCNDLQRAYVSSTYFYFYNPTDDLEDQEEENGQQDNEDDQQGQSEQEDVKTVKKVKGSAIQQKPECKQQ